MSEPSIDRVTIFDTTLRDGEQSPGCSMSRSEKLRVAAALAEMGVDVIEAGFPVASPGDFESVQEIARKIHGPSIAGLARCNGGDIERAWDAVRDADRPRIHVFLATSAIHREHKLRMAKGEIVRRTREGVAQARSLCDDVEFSPEDASRTEIDFLCEVVEAAIDAGATTINVPDTVGYAVPHQYAEVFRSLRRHTRGIDGVVLSAHCHNDLGLAVANSLAAIEAGARQIECTINGIGERAGNCSLEELVMALRTRCDAYCIGCGINTRRLYPVSRLVSGITGIGVQPNKAIVGDNAFAHEAGIHQHGMLQHRDTYEIMRPEDVGRDRSVMVLGKHSGRHAFRDRVQALGFLKDDEQLDEAFACFKQLSDRKKVIYDADIEAIVLGAEAPHAEGWRIAAMQVTSGTDAIPTASVTLADDEGGRIAEAAVGDGPIDAVFKSIERATGLYVGLRAYRVRSVTEGEDAQGEVIVDVEHAGRTWRGRAIGTDIVEASARAFLEVINRIDRVSRNSVSTPSLAAVEGAK